MELTYPCGITVRRTIRRTVVRSRKNTRRGRWRALTAAFLMGLAAGSLVTAGSAALPAASFARGGTVLVRVSSTPSAEAPIPAPHRVLQAATIPLPRAKTPVAVHRPHRWDTHVRARPSRGQFKRFFRMTATAYTPINTRMEGGRYTKTRRDGRSAHGVAVDPDLIPLGSHLWIPGYGHAVADDTGGRIQGHRVDLRMQSARQMRTWGVKRAVRVYVLQEP